MAETKLIRMVRPEPPGGGPATADVHPDEVANYQTGDWRVEETPAGKRGNAAETIKLVAECQTIEALEKIADGEDRKTVLEAIEGKRKELTQPPPGGDDEE